MQYTSKQFPVHKSLDELPHQVVMGSQKITLFRYVPEEGQGGDWYGVGDPASSTLCVLSDMTGHGLVGYNRLQPFINHLEDCLSAVSIQDVVFKIRSIDGILDYHHLMAMSIVRVTGHELFVINAGENLIARKTKQRLHVYPSATGKIGLLKELDSHNQGDIIVHRAHHNRTGYLVLASDGTNLRSDKRLLKQALLHSPSAEEAIKYINSHVQKSSIEDDYTLVGIDLG